MSVKSLPDIYEEIRLKIGNKLKSLRNSKGLTQFRVAGTLLISRMHYMRLEKGEMIPSAMHLYRLAKFYGVSMEWFFDDDSNVPPPGVRAPSDFGADQDTVTELFQVMREVPLIRYSILKDFMEMKQEHKALINSTREKYKEYSETAMKHQSPDQGA
ncbi:MAG: helix-turn-helix transcriptional regulator [Candidatus Aminicenantes bacterium]|nr:helix-turn-helix transcriptional regulator [Candidatus Aminicenantes bacterium]